MWRMEAYLEPLVRLYPTIYVRELQEILANDFQLGPREVPLIAAIARLFTKLKITRKKSQIIYEINHIRPADDK